MAIVWNSTGCRNVAGELSTAASNLESLLNGELVSAINRGKNAYSSQTATQLFNSLEKLRAKSPEFIDSVKRCSNYLSNKVAPAYEEKERKYANQIPNN